MTVLLSSKLVRNLIILGFFMALVNATTSVVVIHNMRTTRFWEEKIMDAQQHKINELKEANFKLQNKLAILSAHTNWQDMDSAKGDIGFPYTPGITGGLGTRIGTVKVNIINGDTTIRIISR